MDFLDKEIRRDLLQKGPAVATRIKDDAPPKFNKGAKVTNTILGGGNIINGEVKESVLFHKVYTGNNSTVKNSIIMNDSYIGNNCKIEYAIIDKGVVISDGKEIIGTKDNLTIISKGTIV